MDATWFLGGVVVGLVAGAWLAVYVLFPLTGSTDEDGVLDVDEDELEAWFNQVMELVERERAPALSAPPTSIRTWLN